MAFDRNKDKDESAIEDPAVKAETEAHPTPAVTPAGAPEGWTPENGAPDAENDNDLPESAPVTEVEHADAAPEAAPVEAKTYDAGEVHAALEKAGYKVADEDEVAEGRLGPSTRASVTEFQYSMGRGGMNALGDVDEDTFAALTAEKD